MSFTPNKSELERISGGMRTKYRGSEEDFAPTVGFVNEWRKKTEEELPRCAIRIGDVNYATDEKIDGVRTAHYEFSTCYGIAEYSNYGGGFVSISECLGADVILPYNWLNPETAGYEPGYVSVQVVAPLGRNSMLGMTEKLVQAADLLQFGYNHMIDAEYEGSRNELIERNAEAEFSTRVYFLSDRTVWS